MKAAAAVVLAALAAGCVQPDPAPAFYPCPAWAPVWEDPDLWAELVRRNGTVEHPVPNVSGPHLDPSAGYRLDEVRLERPEGTLRASLQGAHEARWWGIFWQAHDAQGVEAGREAIVETFPGAKPEARGMRLHADLPANATAVVTHGDPFALGATSATLDEPIGRYRLENGADAYWYQVGRVQWWPLEVDARGNATVSSPRWYSTEEELAREYVELELANAGIQSDLAGFRLLPLPLSCP